MIKAKPRKKNIVKVNEKQEIKITRQPTNEQLEESKLAFTLLNISLICKNHKDIWDKELRENDGIIPFSRYMEICKSRVLADRLFNENFETIIMKRKDGTDKAIPTTKWTQKGRLKIHNILTNLGFLANMDKEKKIS
jgi:hypothetical protein